MPCCTCSLFVHHICTRLEQVSDDDDDGAVGDIRGRHTAIRLGASPSGLISNPLPSSPYFTPDAVPAANLPIYPGLAQAPNMLGLVTQWLSYEYD